MDFELKRKEVKALPIKMGDEILQARLDEGIKRYKDYMSAQHKLHLMSEKAEEMQKTGRISDDFLTIYGECVLALLRTIFSQADIDKIMVFFENDAEEALGQLLPFITGEYAQALKAERQQESRRKLETI